MKALEHIPKTRLCQCWRIRRSDGKVLGLTSHDKALQFDGDVFEAANGLENSVIEHRLGLDVEGMDIVGAFGSESLSAKEMESGKFDGAEIEIWKVDWQEPESRVQVAAGTLGELRRSGEGFSVEMLSLAEKLNRPSGRSYQQNCDARLGDGRCGIGLDVAPFSITLPLIEVEALYKIHLSSASLSQYEAGYFNNGQVEFLEGALIHRRFDIQAHIRENERDILTLWHELPALIEGEVSVRLIVGCDKKFSTCKDKFNNADRFQGFPHMPASKILQTIDR